MTETHPTRRRIDRRAGHVAVAIPAYNEADGIAEFLREIDEALCPLLERLTLVVVDDASTDGTADVVEALAPEISAETIVVRRTVNSGHGPNLRLAYDRALESGAEIVLQVDGDGQFLGADLRRLLVLLEDGAPSVCGVRRFRQDPWVRMTLTKFVRVYVSAAFGVPTRDANCPFRGYHSDVLAALLPQLPADAMVPNLYLTVLAARAGVTMVEVDVSHRVRRGHSAQGTTWRGRRKSLVPWRLISFSAKALRESAEFRKSAQATERLDGGSSRSLSRRNGRSTP